MFSHDAVEVRQCHASTNQHLLQKYQNIPLINNFCKAAGRGLRHCSPLRSPFCWFSSSFLSGWKSGLLRGEETQLAYSPAHAASEMKKKKKSSSLAEGEDRSKALMRF